MTKKIGALLLSTVWIISFQLTGISLAQDSVTNQTETRQVSESAIAADLQTAPVPSADGSSNETENTPETRTEIKEGVLIDELNLDEMNIKDILDLISAKTGFKIVYPENIEGEVSIYLKHIDALDALRIILDDTNLAYDIDENIINVMRADDYEKKYSYSFDVVTKSQIVSVSYAKVLNLIEILKPLKSETGKIIYSGRRVKVIDASSGSPKEKEILILIDKPEKIQSMVTLISKIDIPTDTKTYQLLNTDVQELALEIKASLTKNVGQVLVLKETNELVITETPENLQNIENLIFRYEYEAKKISIEARVIQVDLNDEHSEGIDWEAIVSDYQSIQFKGLKKKSAASEENSKLNLGVITSEDYKVLIEALDTVGDMEEVMSQTLITPNETECELIIPSLDVVTSQETDRRKVSPSDQKIKLYILPNRSERNTLVMRIKPDIINGSGEMKNVDGSQDRLLISADKAIINVPENSLVVVGGLIKENIITAKIKFPLLGDLPIVGLAFSKEGRRLQKSEVIVFLTPQNINNKDVKKTP